MVSESKERERLLRSIVDQFVSRTGHRPSDVQQFERLVCGLFDVAEDKAVVGVAEALCRHPETPPALIARLGARGGACARVVREFFGGAASVEDAPSRPELSREALATLVARGENGLLRALAASRKLRLDVAALRVLASAGRDDPLLARILLGREDLDIDPTPLFLTANESERTAILVSACRGALMLGGGESLADGESGLAAQIESLIGAGEKEGAISLLAEALDAPKSRMRKIFCDEEALALALVALAIDAEAACRILRAAASPGLAAGRLQRLRNLMRSTPRRAALRIIAAVVGSARAEAVGPGPSQESLASPGP